jgi:hypothetical protein
MDRYKILFFSFFGIFLINHLNAYGQQLNENQYNASDTLNSSNFDRVPVTFLIRCENDEYANALSNIIDSIYEYGGIIKNDLEERRLESPNDKERRKQSSYNFSAASYAISEIDNQKIVNEILGKTYNRNVNGAFDFERIRNILNVNKEALIIANSNLSTNRILKNAGEILMDNSYIIVFELFDIKKIESKDFSANNMDETYTIKISAYLYKIEFNHRVATNFYHDLWFGTNDSVSQDKFDKFYNYSFKLSFKQRYDLKNYSVSIKNSALSANGNFVIEKAIRSSIDKLLSKIYIKPYNTNSPQKLISKPPDLISSMNRVRFNSSPKTFIDQKYEVYGLKIKASSKYAVDQNGSVVMDTICSMNKIAEIQLKKASLDQPYLFEYNQLSGKKLDEKYLIKPKRDFGFAITGGYGFSLIHRSDQGQSAYLFGNGGYLFLRGELNLSRIGSKYLHINMPSSVYFFLEGDYTENYYDHYRYNVSKYISTLNGHAVALIYDDLSSKGFKEVFAFSKTTIKFGIGKEFHFKRNFYYTPYLAYGNSKIKYDDQFDRTDYLSQSDYNMLIKLPVEQNSNGEYIIHKVENNDILANQSELTGGFRIAVNLGFNVQLQYSLEGGLLTTNWSNDGNYYFPDMNFADDFDIRMNLALKIQF